MRRAGRGAALLAPALAVFTIAGCAGRPRQLVDAQVPGASEVLWTQRDSVLAVALHGRGLSLLESSNGRERRAWRLAEVPPHAAHGLAVSGAGETLAVATSDSVRVFAGRDLAPLLAAPGRAEAVALSDDGTRLLWSDGTISRLIDVRTGALRRDGMLPMVRGGVCWAAPLGLFVFPYGRELKFIREDLLPDVALGPFLDAVPRRIALSPTGNTLAVAESTTHVSFWDVKARRMRWRLQLEGPARFEHLALSRDALLLATSLGGRARVLWAYSGRVAAEWAPHKGADVLDLAFASDGRRLATVGADGSVRTWAMPARPGRR
jgi:WD40 repeat protein